MTAGLGHNGGPAFDAGFSWRKHSWSKARAELLPTLPVEIVRLRVKRAAELGLPYKTYAGVRAATGHDLIGFLFSSNALRLLRDEQLGQAEQAKLAALKATRTALVHPPLVPAHVAQNPEIDAALRAPSLLQAWGKTRQELQGMIRAGKVSADRLMLIGAGDLEREWQVAGRFAGFLTGDAYFGRPVA